MRILIDTNVLVFFTTDQLDNDTTMLLEDYNNVVCVSSVSVMEFIHLLQNGRIKSRKIKNLDVFDFIENTLGFTIKYTNRESLKQLIKLPTFADHNDPNDRLIIAQAITEDFELISTDTKFSKYIKSGLHLFKASHI